MINTRPHSDEGDAQNQASYHVSSRYTTHPGFTSQTTSSARPNRSICERQRIERVKRSHLDCQEAATVDDRSEAIPARHLWGFEPMLPDPSPGVSNEYCIYRPGSASPNSAPAPQIVYNCLGRMHLKGIPEKKSLSVQLRRWSEWRSRPQVRNFAGFHTSVQGASCRHSKILEKQTGRRNLAAL
ncbi:hypothetical protein FKP32DRAFT_995038 [Trametes sanguinea]|nr:hypothetical protein FKP32DRAFT_995038 [Trametes sanguinea]